MEGFWDRFAPYSRNTPLAVLVELRPRDSPAETRARWRESRIAALETYMHDRGKNLGPPQAFNSKPIVIYLVLCKVQ